MAFTYSGTATETTIRSNNYKAVHEYTFYNNNNILAFYKETFKSDDGNVETRHTLYIKKSSLSTSTPQKYDDNYTLYDADGGVFVENSQTRTIPFSDDSGLATTIIGSHLTPSTDLGYEFKSDLPIFDNTNDLFKYLTDGDDSGRINKDLSVKWDLYIDGTKNPLYKLSWDCTGVPKSDYSKVKVLFCASDDTIANTYIVKDSHYYDYNDKSVKLNYHDIREAVWGDISVKSPVTIIVQFEYFDTTTVVPKGTSSYMYCELFPSEKDGHMYGNIGFCEVGEHSTWFVKTDSGDGSTFTAHDGTEGREGYTKEEDKG